MHAIAEIIMPPDADIKEAVAAAMKEFDENAEDYRNGWWDFYVIGGRFSGHKLEASLDQAKMEAFHEELKKRNVTVSSLTCGKKELQPASQIPMVDALWREWFPGKGERCPIFKHARDQYGKDGQVHHDDVCRVDEIPERLSCEKLLVLTELTKELQAKYPEDGKWQVSRLLSVQYWNGVEHQNSDFDGNVANGIKRIREEKEGWRKVEVGPDWKVVTVDYHS
jgi:hypothetical protein